LLSFLFFLTVRRINLSLRAWQCVITLSSVLCFLRCALFPLSLPIDGRCSPPAPSSLHHPLILSVLFCSLCACSASWALTSHCDPPRATMTLVHSTDYLIEVSAEATDMSCKLFFLSSQHKSICV